MFQNTKHETMYARLAAQPASYSTSIGALEGVRAAGTWRPLTSI